MKRLVFVSVFLICTSIILAQVEQKPKEPSTKLESVLITRGSLLIKEFISLGDLGNASFDTVIIRDANNSSIRTAGIKAEVTDLSRSIRDSNTSFLDQDEIESLVNSISFMVELANKWKAENKRYTEVVFSTKGEFSAGFYQDGNKQTAFISCGSIGKTTKFLKVEDLNKVKSMLERGLTEIKK